MVEINASNWLEESALNHFFRNSGTASPAQLFLALYKTSPTDYDNGLEINGGGYVRQQIIFSAPAQSGGATVITNSNSMTFPKAASDWTGTGETVGFWGIRTAQSGGNLLCYGEFKNEAAPNEGKYAVLTGDRYNVDAGIITIRLSGKGGNWLNNALFSHFFRNIPVVSPSQIYLGLYKSDPTSGDIGVEVTYSEYSRQQVTFAAPVDVSGQSVIRNSTNIKFPKPSTNIGSVAFFGLRDSPTGGNLLTFAPWSISKEIQAGMEFAVDAGLLEVGLN